MLKAAEGSSLETLKSHAKVSTGVSVLDELTYGGLPEGEIYVINGVPGTGKTILAMHFLAAGVKQGETVLCLTLSQREKSVKRTAASVGIDVAGINFRDLSSVKDLQMLTQQQTIFDNSEIELEDTMVAFTQAIDELQPSRVVFDGMSYLQMLADEPMIYRQQLFALRDYLTNKGITAVLTSTTSVHNNDHELVAISHGAITLTIQTTSQGIDWRSLHITKIRGSNYRSGRHDIEISSSGLQIYPAHGGISAIASTTHSTLKEPASELISSNLEALDKLLGGGLQAATSCLIVGPSGTGKSSLCALFAHSYAQRGKKVSAFLFDERIEIFLQRANHLNVGLDEFIKEDRVRCYEMTFGEATPSKFVDKAIKEVEEWGAGIVIIDTLTGYFNAMHDQRRLISLVHDLVVALNRRGVLTLITVSRSGSSARTTSTDDISYLSDTILLLHHFEAQSAIRQAISVYKKRYGSYERGIREICLKAGGIKVGPPLDRFTGILTDNPQYAGDSRALLPLND